MKHRSEIHPNTHKNLVTEKKTFQFKGERMDYLVNGTGTSLQEDTMLSKC